MMDAIITCWENCTSSDLFLGGGGITQNDPGPINWSGLVLVSPDKNHVCRYSVLSRRIMQDFVITLIIRVMDFTIFHH